MEKTKTRIKLTWYAVVVLTLLAGVSIVQDLESVATACVAGIMTTVAGYQASQGYTKAQAIKSNNPKKI